MARGNVAKASSNAVQVTHSVPACELNRLKLNPQVLLQWGQQLYDRYRRRQLKRRDLKNGRMARLEFQHDARWFKIYLDVKKRMIKTVELLTEFVSNKRQPKRSKNATSDTPFLSQKQLRLCTVRT